MNLAKTSDRSSWRLLALAGFFIVLWLSSLSWVQAQTIRVAAQAEIDAETLVLGDIASITPETSELAAIPLGYAPYAGNYRWINRSEIEGLLRKWGRRLSDVDLVMEEDRVLVTRSSRLVSAAELEEAVRAHFEPQGYRVVAVQAPSDLVLPKGELEIAVEPPNRLSNFSNLSVKLNLMLDGRLQRSQWARVSLSLDRPVVVAAGDLPAGHRITASDVRLQQREIQRSGEYFSDAQAVVGTITRRFFAADQPLSGRFLHRPDMVRNGDIVTLVARGPHFMVSTTGRAKGGGKLGDQIAVENLQSKTIVRAVISGEKEVQVNLPGRARQ
ncbi:MAG TPA: flagellar basal body P-ring formation chaperone FlgA [Acidobacteriota bacterium]|nr:flagellar basal body P-ring formation chaperone FlgA [Acidobacteriota bacterium]